MKVSRASCRTVDPIEDGRSPRSATRARAAQSDVLDVAPSSRARVPSLRSIAPTLPAPSEVIGRERHVAVAFDRAVEEVLAPPVSGRRRRCSREWCVDHGVRIDTMSTFELWIAIASREVRADVRVWREGMECWTPVAELPELACAVTDPRAVEPGFEGTGAVPTEPIAQMPPTETLPARDFADTIEPPRAATRSEAETTRPQDGWTRATTPEDRPPCHDVGATSPGQRRPGATPRRTARVANRHLLDLALNETLDLTPPRIPTTGDTTPSPTESTVAPPSAIHLRRRAKSGARWVAVGTAVGILAVGVASLASPSRSTPAAPVARTGIAPAMPATLPAADATDDPVAPEVEERQRRANRGSEGRRRDPGQHRLRRSN
jgi:hypothetical protein